MTFPSRTVRAALACAVTAAAAGSALAAPASAQHVRADQRLDVNNTGVTHAVAGDAGPGAGVAAAAWVDDRALGDRVWVASSRDRAVSWTPGVRVDADVTGAAKRIGGAAVRVSGTHVYVAWLDDRGSQADLWLNASHDGGLSWDGEQRLDDGYPAGARAVTEYALAVDGAGPDVHVLMSVTGPSTGDELRHLHSPDRGASFGSSALVHRGGRVSGPHLVVQGPEVHVAWTDDAGHAGLDDARYQRSLDHGATWMSTAASISGGIPADPGSARVAVRGGDLIAVFQEISALCAVSSNFSTDGGATWLPLPRRVGTSAGLSCGNAYPRPFFFRGGPGLTWADDRSGASQIRMAITADFGATWNERILAASGRDPVVAGDAGAGYVAVQWRDGARVQAVASRDGGVVFGDTLELEGAPAGPVSAPGLAYDPTYANFTACWTADQGGGEHVWTAGFRVPTVEGRGTLAPGTPVRFDCSGFADVETGDRVQVAIARGPGAFPLPGDGRVLPLDGADPMFALTSTHPALRGTLSPAGEALTAVVTVPPSLPSGTTLHYVAVSFAPAGGGPGFGSITDARAVTVP